MSRGQTHLRRAMKAGRGGREPPGKVTPYARQKPENESEGAACAKALELQGDVWGVSSTAAATLSQEEDRGREAGVTSGLVTALGSQP